MTSTTDTFNITLVDDHAFGDTSEPGVYHLTGQLYYRHEEGKVFSSSLAHLAHASATETPFVFAFAEDVPTEALPYSPYEGSTAAQRMDDWTDACDIHLNPISAEAWARARESWAKSLAA